MLCPRCKNPNDDCAIHCQWCGARCAPDPKPQKNPQGKTLKQLVKDGDFLLATQLYVEDTGATVKEAEAYIEKLTERAKDARTNRNLAIFFILLFAFIAIMAILESRNLL